MVFFVRVCWGGLGVWSGCVHAMSVCARVPICKVFLILIIAALELMREFNRFTTLHTPTSRSDV